MSCTDLGRETRSPTFQLFMPLITYMVNLGVLHCIVLVKIGSMGPVERLGGTQMEQNEREPHGSSYH